MLSFSGWNIFSAISITANGQIVNILLNIFFGPAVNAARGVSMQASGAISGFVNNFQIAVNPQIIKSYAAQELESFYRLIKQSAKFSFFLLFFFALPVWIKIDDVLALWLVDVPEYTGSFCRIILIASLINSFSLPLATAANANGNIKKFQLMTGIVELMNIPASYIFLKLGFEATSVFFVNLSIVFITLFIRLNILKSLVRLDIKDFFKTVIAKSILTAIVASTLCLAISHFITCSSLVRLIVFFICSLMSSCFVVYIIGLNKSERRFALNLIHSKITHKQ